MTLWREPEAALLKEVLNDGELRELIAKPSLVPRDVREGLAEICAAELVLGRAFEPRDPACAADRLGPLFGILQAIRSTSEWSRLRALAARHRSLARICLNTVLSALFDTFERAAGGRIRPEDPVALAAFEALALEALLLWGRRTDDVPGSARRPFKDRPEHAGTVAQRAFLPEIERRSRDLFRDSDAIELLTLLGPGRLCDSASVALHRTVLEEIGKYGGIVGRDKALRRLIADLGRSSDRDSASGPSLCRSGPAEVHSVVQSRHLDYLLPSELIKLRDPTLKMLFFARWTEGKLLSYELSDRQRSGPGEDRPRGPAVILVDTSGSMNGAPGVIAKSIVLAVALKMLREGRELKIVLFSAADQAAEIELGHRRKMAAELLEFLACGFDGGTDFNTALRSGLAALRQKPYVDADLLFVTDGLSRVTDQALIDEWLRYREERGSRIVSLVVGNDTAGGLEAFSDRVHLVDGKIAGQASW